MLEQDYILRMIKQLGEAIARIAGLAERGRHAEALELADEACRELLGIQPELLGQMDPLSAAEMLGNIAHIRVYVALLKQIGEVQAHAGDEVLAASTYGRALTVGLEGIQVVGTRDPGTVDDLRALATLIDLDRLDERYTRLLEEVGHND